MDVPIERSTVMSMPVPAPTRMTAEEFLAMPREETLRYELIDGELLVLSRPKPLHQAAVTSLLFEIELWIRCGGSRGFVTIDIDTGVDDWTVLAPDLQWYAADRDRPPLDEAPWPLGDLVIEVRSPSTWHIDVGRKRQIYEREGVRELWLVDPPARSVLVFRRTAAHAASFDDAAEVSAGEQLTSPLLPGFSADVAELFGRP